MESPDAPKDKRLPMVGWFDPKQLAVTAVDVAISTIFGRHADKRLIEAMTLGDDAPQPFVYPKRGQEGAEDFWLDYAADVGDGWNSTYAVAHYLARETLDLTAPDGTVHQTKRGSVLVFGGDEVYPAASRKNYEERLLTPYRAALARTTPQPDVFAVPGNHDWYDSLVSFTRFFLSGKDFGAWQTRQRRSYFALKLPHRWWLFGIDVQLGSDIDVLQQRYFKEIAREIGPDDHIILCTSEPEWVLEKMYSGFDASTYNERTIRDFEERILGHRVDVIIAGDLHHYRRHEHSTDNTWKRQKIIAGGGGAFLHPTHGPDVETLGKSRATFKKRCSYPDEATSRRLCWRNVMFPFLNRTFLWLAGAVYLLSAWAMKMEIPQAGRWAWDEALYQTGEQLLRSPSASFWVMGVLAMFVLFTDTHSTKYRFIGGLSHGLAHLIAIFFISWTSVFLADSFDFPRQGWGGFVGWYLLPGLFIFGVGAFIGSLLMGLYLLSSLNLFGRHSNEAFSALAIQDWKNFLRLRITKNGLTIYPVGIDRVPRKWKQTGEGTMPDDPAATPPKLIERPVVLGEIATHNLV
jgi:hypothetical protein